MQALISLKNNNVNISFNDELPAKIYFQLEYFNLKKKNIDENNPHNHKYHLIKGNSESEEVLKQFKELNIKIDHLFIDGDHSAHGVKRDFYNYLPFMNKGGLILFDNYNDPRWTEVKPATDEIIEECSEIELHSKGGHLCVVRVI